MRRLRNRRWVLMWVATAVPAVLLLWGTKPTFHPLLAEGQRAHAMIVAAVDFTCVDLAATELLRRQAADATPPVFTLNLARRNEILRTLGKLFDQTARVRARYADHPERLEAALAEMVDLIGVPLTPADVNALVPEDQPAPVLEALRETFRRVWMRGIVRPEDRETGFQGVAAGGLIMIEDPEVPAQRSVAVRDLLTPAEAVADFLARAHSVRELAAISEETLRRLASGWLGPNLLFEPALSRQRRAEAERQAGQVLMAVPAGATLIEAGERATAQTVEMLLAHDRRLREITPPHDTLRRHAGKAGLLVLLSLAVTLLYRFFAPGFLDERRNVFLFASLSFLTLLAFRGLWHLASRDPRLVTAVLESGMPVALAPMAASVLAGTAAALGLGAWSAFAMALTGDFGLLALCNGFVVTATAAWLTRRVRSRAAIWRAGAGTALAASLCMLLFALIQQPTPALLGRQMAAAVAASLGSAVAVLVLIPVFETLAGFTTDIRLLELTDPAHPLLQRLATEAPGTYHHSLVVANLAQAAADAIGANGLLARVCAYYHDIGKLARPEFFAENFRTRENPHDRLSPQASAEILRSHVEEGLTLARQYRLPEPILGAIREHHGTSQISFFHQKASAQARAHAPDPAMFRYAGPKPHAREIGVLTLADAVEAASRTLDSAEPDRIRRLVESVADRKRDEKQLDESNLTFDDFRRVKEALATALITMLHRRVPYPSATHEPPPDQPPASPAGPPPDAAAAHPAPDGACPQPQP